MFEKSGAAIEKGLKTFVNKHFFSTKEGNPRNLAASPCTRIFSLHDDAARLRGWPSFVVKKGSSQEFVYKCL